MAVINHKVLEDTATTAEQDALLEVAKISYITNDDATNDLIVNFDDVTTAAGAFTIKKGEVVGPLDMYVGTIYYKSSAATVAFRLLGIKSNTR